MSQLQLPSQLTLDILNGTVNGDEPELYVYDCETRMRSPGKFSADPFYPDNRLICRGFKLVSKADQSLYEDGGRHFRPITPAFVIGCNVKFDLHYMQKTVPNALDNVHGAHDVMVLHHILTGETFKGLDYLCNYYKVMTHKTDVLKEWLKEGKNIEDMPIAKLKDYMRQDVLATEQVFRAQWARMSKEQRQVANIHARVTMALAEMEWNGLHFDMNKLADLAKQCDKDMNEAYTGMEEYTNARLAKDQVHIPKINITSNRTVSSMIFGTSIPYKENELVGKYKNGKDKFKLVDKSYHPSVVITTPKSGVFHTNLGYPVGEGVLNDVLDNVLSEGHYRLGKTVYVENVLKYRKAKKILSTYIEPIAIEMENNEETKVHPNYNQAATPTGRLSSSQPNAQNLHPLVKACISAEDASNWVQWEADWKQLEVCGVAMLSGDPQLIQDIANGVDIHKVVGDQAGIPDTQRRRAKGVVFGTFYGGGVNTLAKTAGLDKQVVGKVQKALFARYPKVKEYYTEYSKEVKASKPERVEYDKSGIGRPIVAMGSITGRSYRYKEQASNWGPDTYSWTETCNYPVQGISTGDIVPAYLALLWVWKKRTMSNNHMSMRLVSTVHDSYTFDWNFSEEPLSNTDVEQILYERQLEFLNLWHSWVGQPLPVPLQLELERKE